MRMKTHHNSLTLIPIIIPIEQIRISSFLNNFWIVYQTHHTRARLEVKRKWWWCCCCLYRRFLCVWREGCRLMVGWELCDNAMGVKAIFWDLSESGEESGWGERGIVCVCGKMKEKAVVWWSDERGTIMQSLSTTLSITLFTTLHHCLHHSQMTQLQLALALDFIIASPSSDHKTTALSLLSHTNIHTYIYTHTSHTQRRNNNCNSICDESVSLGSSECSYVFFEGNSQNTKEICSVETK